MTTTELLRLRLYNQLLVHSSYATAADVVRWLGAVQAQDYHGAKWAIAQRTTGATSDQIDEAFAEGSILRIHVMRPTWHFVAAEDMHWMLTLTAPRVNTLNAYYFRKVGLDDATFTQTNKLLAKILQGNNYATRSEIADALKQSGITIGDQLRLIYILMRAELDRVICSGPLRGKQHTYALLDERVPHPRKLQHDEALAELALRYFSSHGPATLADYIWWSGLTNVDARKGLEMIKGQLSHATVDGKEYWFQETIKPTIITNNTLHLLPNYDEYTVAYKDRSALFDVTYLDKLDSRQNSLFTNVIVINGEVMGTWKRVIRSTSITMHLNYFKDLSTEHQYLLKKTLEQYSLFTGKTVRVE